ncbi:uncharacterized protein EI90DRAFT_3011078 [Cantharellus anzutake]|uniref:uncharacterized protein n=1 Tax=Cantharellus anzutake TaxID=1750568 RepID=UPI0019035639|nr:uncharacterized protein EI90DRAFT_3011078 [Cantharellus anzutake]KAF8344348.1 hypothetical protein EI90DRAFT_3011078 [Cantharellus anzutake]
MFRKRSYACLDSAFSVDVLSDPAWVVYSVVMTGHSAPAASLRSSNNERRTKKLIHWGYATDWGTRKRVKEVVSEWAQLESSRNLVCFAAASFLPARSEPVRSIASTCFTRLPPSLSALQKENGDVLKLLANFSLPKAKSGQNAMHWIPNPSTE